MDSLDQEWREMELEGMQIISSWEDKDSLWTSGIQGCQKNR